MIVGKLPRFQSNAGGLIKSAPFLDGTKKMYFGPGQMPYGITGGTPGPAGSGYIKPTDCNAPGSLLRVPQMVWIGSTLQDLGSVTPFGPAPEWNLTWDFVSIIKEVQSKIHALRPSKTWVDLMDYTGGYLSDNTTYIHNAYYANNPLYYGPNINANPPIYLPPGPSIWNPYSFGYAVNLPLNRLAHLIAPDPSEDFFGTDFYYILFNGYAYYFFGQSSGSPGFPYSVTVSSPPTYRQFYQPYIDSVAQIKGSYSKFARYAVDLYVMDNGEGNIWGQDGNNNTPNYPQVLDYYQQVADDLSNYGYKCVPCPDPSFMDSDYLVGLIAKHFNFDPDTGQDL